VPSLEEEWKEFGKEDLKAKGPQIGKIRKINQRGQKRNLKPKERIRSIPQIKWLIGNFN